MIKKLKYIKDSFQAFFHIRKYFKHFQIIKIYKTFSNLVVLFGAENGNLFIFKLFKNHFLYHDNTSFKNAYKLYGEYNLTNKEVVIKNNYVILHFLPDYKKKQDWLQPLAKSFAKLHQIPTQNIKENINLKKLIEYYESLMNHIPFDLFQKRMRIMDNLEKQEKLLVYCHNDFSFDNFVLYNKSAYFIDIEYSGINDIFCDLAAIKITLQDKFDEFLNSYLSKNIKHRKFIQDNIQNLRQMEYIMLYIAFLWFSILGNKVERKLYKERLKDYNI